MLRYVWTEIQIHNYSTGHRDIRRSQRLAEEIDSKNSAILRSWNFSLKHPIPLHLFPMSCCSLLLRDSYSIFPLPKPHREKLTIGVGFGSRHLSSTACGSSKPMLGSFVAVWAVW